MRAMIINFSGIGNDIYTLPILRCLEDHEDIESYFYQESVVLEQSWFRESVGLKKFSGFFPSEWRRFSQLDLKQINKFIGLNRIDLIINIRNEGPSFDVNYYSFKNTNNEDIDFWDLDFNNLKKELLAVSILRMLSGHGVNISNYNHFYLKGDAFPNHKSVSNIGFFIGGENLNKRWILRYWERLLVLLLSTFPNINITLYPDIQDENIDFSEKIYSLYSDKYTGRISLEKNMSLVDLTLSLRGISLLISTDTFAVHLASAVGIKVFGLYFATDPCVWGGYGGDFLCIRSSQFKECKYWKVLAGNCIHYYDYCKVASSNKKRLLPEDVCSAVCKLLN
ncbi:MAG: glycosyltransferase family 9 protein [Chitinophagales bacterium]